ncbi:hypothetical protein E2986_04322 [Frieseomelitta varia]|uniref:TM7S3/TM198-like domain-containing protein n=1 Tax=Frieseomelitta varia TaxID=561572 RepID=A0A833W1K2_9HYME|nr:hypothetical protein E2986_04322 [Frieseomelitta varia]
MKFISGDALHYNLKNQQHNSAYILDGSVFQVNLTRLHDYSPYTKRIAIEANSKSVFNITNVSSSASFIIFQIHTYQYNVTFSYDKDYLDSNRSVFGSNVGLFSKLTTNIVTQLYVKNDNVHKVEALLVAIAYHDKSPVPGGCNMEFNTEIAPYAMVQTGDTMIIVDVQPASAPFNSVRPNCEKNVVTVEMYHMFLSSWDFSLDSYFAAIINMLTVTDIKENGVEVTSSSVFSPMRRVFNAYTGVGSVYVAVATYGDYSAAYVPAFSYACHPITDPDSCKILSGFWSNLFCVLCFFVGLLSLCLGHYQILIDMAVPMLFMGTVIGYAALDSFTILQNNGIFWTFFVFLSLGIALIILLFDDVASVITCATFSSFMVILSLDYWIGSTLKYIIINFIRRITVEGFNLAIIGPPIHTIDICLIVLWSCLALFRFSKQWCSRGYSSELVETDPLLPHF